MPVIEVVDIHAHILLPGVMGTCGAAGPEMGIRADGTQYFRAGNYVLEDVKFANSPSSVPQLRLEKMEALGIHRQLVSPNPITYFYHAPTKDGIEFSRRHNNQMAEVCRIHSQLVGVATLPLQDVQASCEELRRAVNDLGLVASYLGTNIAGRPLSDPCFADLWATHEKLGVPVMLHSAPRGVYEDPGPFFSQWELDVISGFNVDEGIAVAYLLFGGVLDRHPALHVHVAHGGGFSPYHKGRLQTALSKRPWVSNLLSRSFDDMWQQLSFDTAVHHADALRFLIDTEGGDRVLLGSNFAGWDVEDRYQELLAGLRLPANSQVAILGDNARPIFRLG